MSVNATSAGIAQPKKYVMSVLPFALSVVVLGCTLIMATQPAHSSSDWVLRACLVAVMLLGGVYVVANILFDAFTTFDESGIKRPTFTGRRTYRWDEIRLIQGRGNLVDFVFATGSFRLNLFVFRNDREVVSFVRDHVPSERIKAT